MLKIMSVTCSNFRPWYICTEFLALKNEHRCKIRCIIYGLAVTSSPSLAVHCCWHCCCPCFVPMADHSSPALGSLHILLSRQRVVEKGPQSGVQGLGSVQHSCSQWLWPTRVPQACSARHRASLRVGCCSQLEKSSRGLTAMSVL